MSQEWFTSEWAPGGFTAVLGGVVADVWPNNGEDYGDGSTWSWKVMPTAEVSEWPEAWDAGGAKSEGGAKKSAGASLKKAAAYYKGSKGAQD